MARLGIEIDVSANVNSSDALNEGTERDAQRTEPNGICDSPMGGDTCLWLAAHQNLTPLADPTRSVGSSANTRQPTFAEDRLWAERPHRLAPGG